MRCTVPGEQVRAMEANCLGPTMKGTFSHTDTGAAGNAGESRIMVDCLIIFTDNLATLG